MEIKHNLLYLLHQEKFFIYNLLQGTKIAEFVLHSNTSNMSVDENVIYFSSPKVDVFLLDKECKTVNKRINLKNWEPCGLGIDVHYLYVCDRQQNRILVFNKERLKLIRQFGNPILKRPTSIILDNELLYIMDLERIVVLNIKGEIFQVIGEGIPGVGNTQNVAILPRNFCIANNRLYVQTQNSRVLIFE